MDYKICPLTEICPIYKNWADQTGKKKIDLISLVPSRENPYFCLAKEASEDPMTEEGIPIGEELRDKLHNFRSPCTWVDSLNLLYRISNKIGDKK